MKLNDAKTKMARLRSDLQAEVDTITSNPNYSTDGIVHQVAKAILDARQQAVSLRDDFVTTSDNARRTLGRKLFGLPANADPATTLSYRDAEDRVARITDPDELAPALTRALDKGDDILARAIAGRADTLGCSDVVSRYADSTGQTDDVAALNDLPSGGNFDTACAMVFNVHTPNLPADVADRMRSATTSTGDLRADLQLQRLAETPPEQPTKPEKPNYYL
ncbi:hypothetical protein [Mycobacterium sp. pW045]|uniref:hypothetical protein n=1 Tax=Mycobacterium sp. pW045 TaxID=3238984 RepID=UPI00351B9C8A